RNLRIQSGSFFMSEIWLTISASIPLRALKKGVDSVWKSYLLKSPIGSASAAVRMSVAMTMPIFPWAGGSAPGLAYVCCVSVFRRSESRLLSAVGLAHFLRLFLMGHLPIFFLGLGIGAMDTVIPLRVQFVGQIAAA